MLPTEESTHANHPCSTAPGGWAPADLQRCRSLGALAPWRIDLTLLAFTEQPKALASRGPGMTYGDHNVSPIGGTWPSNPTCFSSYTYFFLVAGLVRVPRGHESIVDGREAADKSCGCEQQYQANFDRYGFRTSRGNSWSVCSKIPSRAHSLCRRWLFAAVTLKVC